MCFLPIKSKIKRSKCFVVLYCWFYMKPHLSAFTSILMDVDSLLFWFTAGEKGVGTSTGKPLHYKGSFFHRIIKGFMAQVCIFFSL